MWELTERKPLCGSRGALQVPALGMTKLGAVTFIMGPLDRTDRKKPQVAPLRVAPGFGEKHPKQVSAYGAAVHLGIGGGGGQNRHDYNQPAGSCLPDSCAQSRSQGTGGFADD